MIEGGYYIKARKIQESEISNAPPHIREIWDLLLMKCNYVNGRLKRGECLISYKQIQEDLSWYVGWRKHSYTKGQCEIAMKWLRKTTMITTRKTTRGMVVTVCNYEYYQDPKNYEYRSEAGDDDRNKTEPYNKNGKKKNKEEELLSGSGEAGPDKDYSLKGGKGKPPSPSSAEPPPLSAAQEKRELNKKAAWVINELNKHLGSKYQESTEGILKHIRARLKEGYVAADFRLVITRKVAQWKNDDKMCKYLRPSTLFNSERFPEYINELQPESSIAGAKRYNS